MGVLVWLKSSLKCISEYLRLKNTMNNVEGAPKWQQQFVYKIICVMPFGRCFTTKSPIFRSCAIYADDYQNYSQISHVGASRSHTKPVTITLSTPLWINAVNLAMCCHRQSETIIEPRQTILKGTQLLATFCRLNESICVEANLNWPNEVKFARGHHCFAIRTLLANSTFVRRQICRISRRLRFPWVSWMCLAFGVKISRSSIHFAFHSTKLRFVPLDFCKCLIWLSNCGSSSSLNLQLFGRKKTRAN